MAGKMARSEDFKTPRCRVSYAQQLFKPKAAKGSTVEKYGCTLIFQESDRAALEKVIGQVIVEQWGEKGLERAKKGLIKSPLLSGTGKEARDKTTGELHPGMGEGLFFVRVQSLYEPVVRYKSANIPATLGNGEDQIKSGDYGFAVLNAFAWNNDESGDGVSFGIQFFQKTGAGEVLGGGGGSVDPEKWHETVEDAGEAPESTKSGAGAGGLFGG